jgi:hypothetical protein
MSYEQFLGKTDFYSLNVQQCAYGRREYAEK